MYWFRLSQIRVIVNVHKTTWRQSGLNFGFLENFVQALTIQVYYSSWNFLIVWYINNIIKGSVSRSLNFIWNSNITEHDLFFSSLNLLQLTICNVMRSPSASNYLCITVTYVLIQTPRVYFQVPLCSCCRILSSNDVSK